MGTSCNASPESPSLETAKIQPGNIATVCFVIFQMTLNTTKGQVTAHNLPYPKSRSFASLTDMIILYQKGKTITAHALILALYHTHALEYS